MREFSDQDHDAILAIHDRWIADEIAGNGLAVLQYCSDDVRWLVPGGREVVGKDAARQLLMPAGITIHSIATSDVRVEGSGGLAYKTAAYETRYMVEASGETGADEGDSADLAEAAAPEIAPEIAPEETGEKSVPERIRIRQRMRFRVAEE